MESTAFEILDIIDSIKTTISDNVYKVVVEKLAKVHSRETEDAEELSNLKMNYEALKRTHNIITDLYEGQCKRNTELQMEYFKLERAVQTRDAQILGEIQKEYDDFEEERKKVAKQIEMEKQEKEEFFKRVKLHTIKSFKRVKNEGISVRLDRFITENDKEVIRFYGMMTEDEEELYRRRHTKTWSDFVFSFCRRAIKKM